MDRVLEPEVMDTEIEAENYRQMDHSVPNQNFVSRLIELGAEGEVLDIGCGPGDISFLIAGQIENVCVTGVDLSEQMLEIAATRLNEEGTNSTCRFQLADAKDLPFNENHFDTVCSNTILHHIPEPLEFVQEAWRVLKPGGVFLIRDLIRPENIAQVNALVEKHAANESEYSKGLFHASLCASLTVQEMEALAKEISPELKVAVDSDRHMSIQGVKL